MVIIMVNPIVGLMAALWRNDKSVRMWNLPKPCATFRVSMIEFKINSKPFLAWMSYYLVNIFSCIGLLNVLPLAGLHLGGGGKGGGLPRTHKANKSP